MSVQVKTPTKSRFGNTVQCGDRSFSSPEFLRRSKDDFNLKNDTRSAQVWTRKRRYSQTYRKDEASVRRKRLRSTPYIGPLPNRFLNGGSIDDPLNLNGLDSSELGRELNAITPESSPLPTPRRQSVEVRVPFNITDPLNLNDSDEDTDLEKKLKKKKSRNRHKKKDELALFSPPKHINKDKSLMEALKIDVEPEPQNQEFVKPRPVSDKIVSPVIRQDSPKNKKRRRTYSEGKQDTTASTSRSLSLSSSISPVLKIKFDKKITPKKQQNSKSLDCKPQTGNSQKGDKTCTKFVYGNYNRYYGYRNPCMEEDKRLNSFKKDWFEGKRVLDIGCNVGQMTLSLARDYQPSKIVGIDIDAKLISVARKNIRFYMSSTVNDTQKYPISNTVNYGPITAPPVTQKGASKLGFPHNVLFMQGNYVLESDELLDLQKEEYDVILALSVTKWIHFNWGDDGLKRFFKRVYKQLRPGGRFILEPQPWSSYKKKKKLTVEIFENFKSIQLRPDQFTDYLLSREIGFSTCNTIDVPYNPSKGFRRPIIVFTKSETVQNSPWSETESVTPLRSYQPAMFGSHLSHISEDSSCSCSSYSQQSYFAESNPASVSNPASTYGEDSFPNPPSLDTANCADAMDFQHSSVSKEQKADIVLSRETTSTEQFIFNSGTASSEAKTEGNNTASSVQEGCTSDMRDAECLPIIGRKRSNSDSMVCRSLSERTIDKCDLLPDLDNPIQFAKHRKENNEKIHKDSNENVEDVPSGKPEETEKVNNSSDFKSEDVHK